MKDEACTPRRRICAPFFQFLRNRRADLLEDLSVELSGGRQSVGAGDGGEILVAQFELNGAGVELGFAEAAGHHFGKAHQRGFELGDVGGVFVVGVLVADGFRADVGSDFGIEPSAGIFAAGLAGQSEAPFAEAVGEIGFFEAGQVSNFLDAERVEVGLHDLADAGNFADFERGEKFGFFAGTM